MPMLTALAVMFLAVLAFRIFALSDRPTAVAEAQEPPRGGMGAIPFEEWAKRLDESSGEDRLRVISQQSPMVGDKVRLAKRLIEVAENDRDAAARAAAAAALAGGRFAWRGFDPSPALIRVLSDPDPDVRAAAAGALADYTGPDVEAALERASMDKEPAVSNAASVGLVATWSATKRWDRLIPLLGTPDQDVGAQACLKLQQAGRQVVPTLIEALSSGRYPAPVREGIVEVLSTVCNGDNIYQKRFAASTFYTTRIKEVRMPVDPRAVEPLIAALKDPDESVREMAAQGLGYMGDKRAVGPLNEILLHDPSVIVRRRAASALITLPSEGALEGLKRAADEKTEASSDVRTYAVEALGWMESDAAIEPLIAALGDSDPEVRAMAARHLGQRRDKRAVPALLKVLAEREEVQRMQKIVAEREAEVKRLSREMRRRGATLEEISQVAKQHALATKRFREAANRLDTLYDVRWQAARSLGKIRDESAREGLIAAVTEPYQAPQVVQAARDALRKLGTMPPPTPWELEVTGG